MLVKDLFNINKQEGGNLYLDFIEIVDKMEEIQMDLNLVFTQWIMREVTVHREVVAVSVDKLYEKDEKLYQRMLDLCMRFNVKFLIEELENIGKLDGNWDNLFYNLSDFSSIISEDNVNLPLKEKLVRIDKLLNRENKHSVQLNNLTEIPNFKEVILEIGSITFNNFIIPKAVFLSSLQDFDAIEVVKVMKDEYPECELILDTSNVIGKLISDKEVVEIIITCVKNNIPVDYSNENQGSIKRVYEEIYIRLNREGIEETIEKHKNEFGNLFAYTEDMVYFYSVEIEKHMFMPGYILKPRKSNKDCIYELDNDENSLTYFKPKTLQNIGNNEYYVSLKDLNNREAFLINEIFIAGVITEEEKGEYNSINWRDYID